ncbi:MAG: hypothetical protein NTY38_20070 [Acidobacteria bacterium]|nr:hypothetical protein [Acidobacteriota bacterium]
MTAITPVTHVSIAEALSAPAAAKPSSSGFGAVLNQAIQQVEGGVGI